MGCGQTGNAVGKPSPQSGEVEVDEGVAEMGIGICRSVEQEVLDPAWVFCGQRQSHRATMGRGQKVRGPDARLIHERNHPVGLGLQRGVDARHAVRLANAQSIHGVHGGFFCQARNRQLPGRGGAEKAVHQNELRSEARLEAVHPVPVHLDPMLFDLDTPESVQHPTANAMIP